MRHLYTITKQYMRGSEIALDEKFNNFNDAKAFVEKKLTADILLKVRVTYRIFEDDKLKGEYDESKIDLSAKQAEDTQSSQGKGSGASFRPTPLSTAPRPPGTPQKWNIDKDDEKKDKK